MIKGGFYSEVKVLFSFLTASNDCMNLFTSQSQEAIHLLIHSKVKKYVIL